MKKFLLIFLCFISGWSAIFAKEEYIIEMYGGFVRYKNENSKEWQSVSNNLILSINDSICLEKGGYVTIGYRNTPYKFSSPCTARIYDLVREKRLEQSKQYTTKSFLQEISANREEKDFQMGQIPMRQIGKGENRGDGNDTIDYERLSQTLARVGALACSKKKSPQIKGIAFNKIITDEGLSFEYSNSSGQDYYINVLHVNKRTKKISLCYVIMRDVKEQACPITPNGFTSCNREIYFPNTEDDVYVLIALDYPYDSYVLDNELFYYPIDTVCEDDVYIKYMW